MAPCAALAGKREDVRVTGRRFCRQSLLCVCFGTSACFVASVPLLTAHAVLSVCECCVLGAQLLRVYSFDPLGRLCLGIRDQADLSH